MDINSKILQHTNRLKVPAKLSREEAWAHLSSRMDDHKIRKQRFGQKTGIFVGSFAAAAVFIVVLYLGMFNTGKYSPDIITKTGETRAVYLPDSSLIVLNSNSKTNFHYNRLTNDRKVRLEGEAMFDVRNGRKFSVVLSNAEIKVRGTRFNVFAYSKDYLQVHCLEGSVEVVLDNSVVKLSEMETVKLYKGVSSFLSIDRKDNINERINGIYYWEKIKLEELLEVIACRFDYEVKYASEVPDRHFSGKIDLSNLYNGLNIVSYAMDLKYMVNKEEKTITIHAR